MHFVSNVLLTRWSIHNNYEQITAFAFLRHFPNRSSVLIVFSLYASFITLLLFVLTLFEMKMCFILLFAFLLLSVKRCATFNHGTGTVVLICKLSPQILEWHAVRFDCVLQTVFERVNFQCGHYFIAHFKGRRDRFSHAQLGYF